MLINNFPFITYKLHLYFVLVFICTFSFYLSIYCHVFIQCLEILLLVKERRSSENHFLKLVLIDNDSWTLFGLTSFHYYLPHSTYIFLNPNSNNLL